MQPVSQLLAEIAAVTTGLFLHLLPPPSLQVPAPCHCLWPTPSHAQTVGWVLIVMLHHHHQQSLSLRLSLHLSLHLALHLSLHLYLAPAAPLPPDLSLCWSIHYHLLVHLVVVVTPGAAQMLHRLCSLQHSQMSSL